MLNDARKQLRKLACRIRADNLPGVNIYHLICLTFLLGGFGGFVNCAIAGEFHLPDFDKNAKVWKPGWLGDVLVGGVASVVVWGIYGPLASFDLAGSQPLEPRLTLTSLVVGLGGGRILTLESQKLILKSEADVERKARIVLTEAIKSAKQ